MGRSARKSEDIQGRRMVNEPGSLFDVIEHVAKGVHVHERDSAHDRVLPRPLDQLEDTVSSHPNASVPEHLSKRSARRKVSAHPVHANARRRRR